MSDAPVRRRSASSSRRRPARAARSARSATPSRGGPSWAGSGGGGVRSGPSACSSPCPSSSSGRSPSGSARATAAAGRRLGSSTSPRAGPPTSASCSCSSPRSCSSCSSPPSCAATRCRPRRLGVTALPARRARPAGPAAHEQARHRHRLDPARHGPAAGLGPARRRHRLRPGPADQPARGEPLWGQFLPRLASRWATSSCRCRPSRPSPSGSARARTPPSRRWGAPCSSASCFNILDQLDALDPYRNAFRGTTRGPGRKTSPSRRTGPTWSTARCGRSSGRSPSRCSPTAASAGATSSA